MSPVHDMKPEKCEKNDENDFEYIEEMGYHAQPETLRERMPRRSKRRRLEVCKICFIKLLSNIEQQLPIHFDCE